MGVPSGAHMDGEGGNLKTPHYCNAIRDVENRRCPGKEEEMAYSACRKGVRVPNKSSIKIRSYRVQGSR